MMNYFLWDAAVERAVNQVRQHAEKRENWYRPGPGAKPPGEDAHFVAWAGTTRAVFTWTVAPSGVIRHLTVSVRGKGRAPRPEACWTFAHHFGFTGASRGEHGLFDKPGRGWSIELDDDPDEDCVVIQQLVAGTSDEPAPSAAS